MPASVPHVAPISIIIIIIIIIVKAVGVERCGILIMMVSTYVGWRFVARTVAFRSRSNSPKRTPFITPWYHSATPSPGEERMIYP